jgi:hypothetical protein
VTNEGDWVPALPPRHFPYTEAYAHTGIINVHCKCGEHPHLTTASQGFRTQAIAWKNPIVSHNLQEYWRNLCNSDLAEESIFSDRGGEIDISRSPHGTASII